MKYTSGLTSLLGKRVGYVRPLGNVGDDLIELAMTQLFAEFGVRWSLCDLPRVADFDLLVFGGGGNMGTRYMNNYELRRKALAAGLPLIVLPQSFATPEEGAFQRVFVRERESLRLHPAGILAPDLALGLAWPAPGRATKDLGVFLRRDRERKGTRQRLFARDPVKLCRTVGPYLALAAAHRRIITDRLHFAIAGLHAGRDVMALANDYHKNRSMHDTWLADLSCRFAGSLEEALPKNRRAA
ncbi:MAG TPA: polysaccharide pyruvyl transferase family protein [Pirellulales bacterium]